MKHFSMLYTYKVVFVIVSILLFSCRKENNKEVYGKENKEEAFIAHAGGKIDGYIYTNSLEAMDLSYSKGCRMFELDISKTSDNNLLQPTIGLVTKQKQTIRILMTIHYQKKSFLLYLFIPVILL